MIQITVNQADNQLPIANAGTNINITLPDNTASLDASNSSDPDGSLVSFLWEYVSGPDTYTIEDPNAITTQVSNLQAGVYSFRLTVTDNNGDTNTDMIYIYVKENDDLFPPQYLSATDGESQSFVNITWETIGEGFYYKVYRSEYNDTTSAIPISNWITNNYFQDSSLTLSNVYFYFAQTSTDSLGTKTSNFSNSDSGFISLQGEVILLSKQAIVFDKVYIDSVAERNISITNIGNKVVNIDSISFPESFSGDWQTKLINPNESKVLTIKFNPNAIGFFNGEMIIHSNAINEILPINISGECISTVTALTEEESSPLLVAYPNPAETILNITFNYKYYGSIKIDIIDLSGKIVKTDFFIKKEKKIDDTIDISTLARGTYLLKATLDGEVIISKINVL